ncbi:50S ribosomal protein L11 methyltransferase [Atopobacter sp. AH10]|uniref:50S ribosomal protein L11 methyltransferase n=1 Tax=Atopobacter sp. AH10 TaxID=2315861 RepID=UPI000EF1F85C|nr:50S ribosomal protein L11 methyltransferase [Atopobacter sp. AH10]RLK62475.1 50S ribosomal protein L11 methyltransferase [Atopobacter sp. AH10]
MEERYIKVSFYPEKEDLAVLEASLMQLGFTSLEIHDHEDIEKLKEDLPKWELLDEDMLNHKESLEVIIYVDLEVWQEGFYKKLLARLEEDKSRGLLSLIPKIKSEKLESKDWQEGWKAYYKPIHLTRFMAIVPVWEENREELNLPVKILLDPGLAFGTGSHPTTKMCLLALEQFVRPGYEVVDVGCGSGILSIAAGELGASQVYSYDIDPNCEKIVLENARFNAHADRLKVATGNLLDAYTGKADLIVANILAGVLEEMAKDVPNALKDDGHLILSGFLSSQMERVCKPFEEEGLKVLQVLKEKDWTCVVMAKEED